MELDRSTALGRAALAVLGAHSAAASISERTKERPRCMWSLWQRNAKARALSKGGLGWAGEGLGGASQIIHGYRCSWCLESDWPRQTVSFCCSELARRRLAAALKDELVVMMRPGLRVRWGPDAPETTKLDVVDVAFAYSH